MGRKNVEGGFPVLYDDQITTANSGAAYQPGQIFAWRGGTNRAKTALVQYIQLDNNGCDRGNALVQNYATLNSYSVTKSATTNEGAPFVGVALATIASQYFGFIAIKGYVEKAYQSQTTASGEYLMVSGTTAGMLSNNKASVFNAGTMGSSSMFMNVALSCGIAATDALGSVMLLGCWGV